MGVILGGERSFEPSIGLRGMVIGGPANESCATVGIGLELAGGGASIGLMELVAFVSEKE
jgi:hypothetical protein